MFKLYNTRKYNHCNIIHCSYINVHNLMYFPPDVLLNNLVLGAISQDAKDNFNKPPKDRITSHTDALLHAIRSCGVSFSIWEKTNADGSGSGTYDFTS